MEYEIDNELKYTTLYIRATLDLRKMNEKAKKGHGRKSPQGDGEWAQKSLFKKLFLLTAVTISEK